MGVRNNSKILILRLNLPLESSKILFYFENLKIPLQLFIFRVGIFFLFDQIKQSDYRILFLINATNNLAVMNILILGNLKQSSIDLSPLQFKLPAMNHEMMKLLLSSQ